MTDHKSAGRAGVAPSLARCGLCGRSAPLRTATRDETATCQDCWDEYERACDDEDAYWQRQGEPEARRERPSAAEGAQDDADVHEGAADGSNALAPWLRAVRRVALNWHRPI